MRSITKRETVFQTPWFNLEARQIEGYASSPPHYVVCGNDYVCVVPVTDEGNILLVQQYRPAVDAYVLELPSGTVDKDMTPETAILREIREETGWRSTYLELIGELWPDVGRLGMKQYIYFSKVEPDPERLYPEEGEIDLKAVSMPIEEFMLTAGRQNGCLHALNLAAVFLAIKHGKLSFE